MSGFAGQAATILFGRSVIRVAQFITFLLLARALSPAEFGWFGIITTALGLAATLGSLGLRQAFAFEIGAGRVSQGVATSTAISLWLPLSVISGGVVFLLYGEQIPGVSATSGGVLIFAGVAFSILHTLLQGSFLGSGTIWAFSLSESLPRLLLLASAAIAFVFSSLRLPLALGFYVIGFAITVPIMLSVVLHGQRLGRPTLRRLPSMLRYGVIFAINLFLVTLCTRVSIFIVESSFGAASAGQFFAASRVNEIFLEITTAVGLVLFSSAVRGTDSKETIARGARAGAWMFWLFAVASLPVILLAPVLLGAVVGPGYEAAIPALQVLALSLAPTSACKMLYPSIAGAGHPWFGTPMIAASLIVNVALSVLLVPNLGVVGAAFALVAGQYVLLIGYVITCRVKFGQPVSSMLIPDLKSVRVVGLSGIVSRAVRLFRKKGDTNE